MREDLLLRLSARTATRAGAALLRRARVLEHVQGPWLELDGRRLLGFCSNDYLGLAQHPLLVAALKRCADDEGVGAGAAGLVCGYRREHAALEEALAAWTGREAARLFSTGYMANLGVLQALLDRGDCCVQDRLNHASLIDAAHLCGATLKRYPHGDAEAAGRQLDAAAGSVLLATDGVFSMDGDLAPLPALSRQCARAGATLMVDDAHGLGVCGPQGAGSVAAAGLATRDVPILMGTLGKALGCQGAFVAGPLALVEGLDQFARTHIYTTAMPPSLAAAAHTAVGLARDGDDRRQRLAALIQRFRRGARELGLDLLASNTPIQPIRLGQAGRALAVAAALEQHGILVGAIRPPTVPQGSARLRVTLGAAHEEEHVDRLLDALDTATRATAAMAAMAAPV